MAYGNSGLGCSWGSIQYSFNASLNSRIRAEVSVTCRAVKFCFRLAMLSVRAAAATNSADTIKLLNQLHDRCTTSGVEGAMGIH
jgi:hypothetical protein